jgi:WD40 repeat protein
VTSAGAQDQGPYAGTDLYVRPVLAVDPSMHAAQIRSLSVDRDGRLAVTGGDDRTVRIWSVEEGNFTLLNTLWIPVGPDPVGDIYAVAISPDGSVWRPAAAPSESPATVRSTCSIGSQAR